VAIINLLMDIVVIIMSCVIIKMITIKIILHLISLDLYRYIFFLNFCDYWLMIVYLY